MVMKQAKHEDILKVTLLTLKIDALPLPKNKQRKRQKSPHTYIPKHQNLFF